ncbi:MAG: hypothetical protein ACOWWR_17330 [Eubacteriales bacterium]
MKKIFSILLVAALVITGTIGVSGIGVLANEKGSEDYIQITSGFSVDDEKGGQQIPKGSIIKHFEDDTTEVYDSTNSLILRTSNADANFIKTPSGYRKANHVYCVPDGTAIHHNGNILTFFKDKKLILTVIDKQSNSIDQIKNKMVRDSIPGYFDAGGWVEYAQETGIQLDYFSANWTCPSAPPVYRAPVVDYIFPGIEPWYGNIVLQPVLQWNMEGEEESWTGACWYVYIWGDVHSASIDVSVGDSLTGYMSNTSSDTWYVNFRNNSTSTSVGISIPETSIYAEPMIGNKIFCTLESWHDDQNELLLNNDMPGDTTFSNITVQLDGLDVDINWDEGYGNAVAFALLTRDVDISGSSSVTLNTAN